MCFQPSKFYEHANFPPSVQNLYKLPIWRRTARSGREGGNRSNYLIMLRNLVGAEGGT